MFETTKFNHTNETVDLNVYPLPEFNPNSDRVDSLLTGITYQKRLLDLVSVDTAEYYEIKSNLAEAIEQLTLEVNK